MTMVITQVRLPEGLLTQMNKLVNSGLYGNKSDVIRDAVRRLVTKPSIQEMIGIIPPTGNSVKEVRKIRNKLSKQIKSFKDLEEINKLAD